MSALATDRAGILLRPASEVQGMQPGLYVGVPFSEYLKLPALSNSFLCGFERSPGFAIWNKEAPFDDEAETAADLGKLVHTLSLEPETFKDLYLVSPTYNLRTNQGKADAEAFAESAKAAGMTPIDTETMRKATLMVGSLKAHPGIRWPLEHPDGLSEVTVIWRDAETGLLCKARIDRLVPTPDGCVALDVKTTGDIERIKWSTRDYGYDRQKVHYTEGLLASGFANVLFYFGFVSSSRSLQRYPVRFVELDEEKVVAAQIAQRARLAKYKQCVEFNEFMEPEII